MEHTGADYKPHLDLDFSKVYFQSLLKGAKIAEDFDLLMISSNNPKDATVFYLCFFSLDNATQGVFTVVLRATQELHGMSGHSG